MAQIKKWNVFYTLLLFINSFGFGLCATLFGAILVDLRILYGVSINTMLYLTFPSAVGYLTGSLGSFLYRWIPRQLALSGFLLIIAAFTFAIPFLGNIWLLFADYLISGIGTGGYDSGYSVWLVELWPEQSAAVLQAAYFIAGIGSICGPLIAAPFLHGEVNGTSGILRNEKNETFVSLEKRMWDISIPLGISGIIFCISPIIWIITFFLHQYRVPENAASLKKEDLNNNPDEMKNSEKEEDTPLDSDLIPNRRGKVAILALAVSCYFPVESGYLAYSATVWQYLELRLSASEAAFLLSLLTATVTIGRLLNVAIALKVKPGTFLSYHYVLIISSLLLLFFGRTNLKLVYIGTGCLGFGFSAMGAGFLAFTERHLRLTAKIASLYAFLGASIMFLLPLVLGQTLDHYPKVIFLLEGTFVSLSLLCFIVVRIWIAVQPRESTVVGKSKL